MKKIFPAFIAAMMILSFGACQHGVNNTTAEGVGGLGQSCRDGAPLCDGDLICTGGVCLSETVDPPPPEQKFMSLKSITVEGNETVDFSAWKDVIAFHYDDEGRLKNTILTQNSEKPALKKVREDFTYNDDDSIETIKMYLGYSVNDMKEMGTFEYVYKDGKLSEVIFQHPIHGPDRKISVEYDKNVATWHLHYYDKAGNSWVEIGPEKGKPNADLAKAIFGEHMPDNIAIPETLNFFQRTIEYDDIGLPKKDSHYSFTNIWQAFFGMPDKNISSYLYDDEMKLSAILSAPEEPTKNEISKTIKSTRFYRSLDGKPTHMITEMEITAYRDGTDDLVLKRCDILEVVKTNPIGAIIEEKASAIVGPCMGWESNSERKDLQTTKYEYIESDVKTVIPQLNKIRMFPSPTLYGVDEPASIFGTWDSPGEIGELINISQLMNDVGF